MTTVDRIVIHVDGGPWSQAEAWELAELLLDVIVAGNHDGVDSVRVHLESIPPSPEGEAA